MNKNTLIVLIVVAIVGGFVWYSGVLSSVLRVPVTSNDNLPTDGLSAGFMKLGPDALYAAEQRPGKELVINIVNLASPGYVVIHESKDEKPGAIIGNSVLLENTESKNIKMTLSRTAKDGEELIAMLHTEREVAGFDPSTDLPVRDTANNIIYMIFHVSASAPDPSSAEVMF